MYIYIYLYIYIYNIYIYIYNIYKLLKQKNNLITEVFTKM